MKDFCECNKCEECYIRYFDKKHEHEFSPSEMWCELGHN